MVAIKNNRLNFSSSDDQKWLVGVMRKKALQESRTVSRRKKRDMSFSTAQPQETESASTEPVADAQHTLNNVLSALTPAARKVAVLVIHGLTRQEICTLLGLSSTAFRQRLTTIRKALGPLPSDLQQEVIALAYASRQQRGTQAPLPVGLIRRALLKSLPFDTNAQGSAVGTHDPSGHLIVLAPSTQKKL